MNKYMPEGALISTLKNREYTCSLAGLEMARERGIILEGGVILCDHNFNLHVDISPKIRAIIPKEEAQYVKDGEEISLLDTIAVDNGICEEIESAERCKALLDKIEEEFCRLQERTMPIVSAMMTVRICKTVCDNRISVDGYSFIDREIIMDYVCRGHVPTQRDIADRFGKNETSVSRTVKEFVEKLKTTL